jgi:hypothetical protein
MPPVASSKLNILGLAGIAACLLAFATLGNIAAFRVVGVVVILHGVYVLITRSVPFGIKGRPASFYLTGIAAILFGILLGVIGLLLVLYPSEASRMLSSTPS